MILRCSRCGKQITDTVIDIMSSVTIKKLVDNRYLKSYENAAEPTHEYLCLNCFDDYADCLNTLSKKYTDCSDFNIVQVVDDVQYN